jgi:flavoprotein
MFFFSFKTEIAAVVIQQIRMRNANKFMAMKSVKILDSPENQSARVQQFYIKKFFLSYI